MKPPSRTSLRPLIRQILAEQVPHEEPQTGPHVKGSPAAQAAEEKLDDFAPLNSMLKNISTVRDLQAVIQNILTKVSDYGKIDQREMMSALTKTVTASRNAATEKRKQDKQAKKDKAAVKSGEATDRLEE